MTVTQIFCLWTCYFCLFQRFSCVFYQMSQEGLSWTALIIHWRHPYGAGARSRPPQASGWLGNGSLGLVVWPGWRIAFHLPVLVISGVTKGTVGEGGSLRLYRGVNETVAGPGFLVLGYLLSCVRLAFFGGWRWGLELLYYLQRVICLSSFICSKLKP